jgi:hypothetical protein
MTAADATNPLHAEWVQGRSRRLFKAAQTARWPVSLLLLIGAFVVVGLNRSFSDVFRDAGRISSETLAVIFLSLIANALAASWRFQVVAGQIGHRISFRRAMAAVGAGSLIGAVFFQIAGQLIGRNFVMARTAVPFASVVVLTACERFIAAVVSALLALAGAYFVFGNVYLDQEDGGGALIKIMAGLLTATACGALLGYGRMAARSVAPWLTRNFAAAFLQLVALTLIVQCPMMIAYVAAAHALSPPTPIAELAATSAIVMFAASVPISLAGWGVREMSAVVALGTIGVAPQDALLAAVIIGTGSLLAMLVLTGVALPGSLRRSLEGKSRTFAQIDYARILVWVVPLAVATLVFFQIYVPIGSGTLLNVNLADPLAILGGVLFVLSCLQSRQLPQWRFRHFNIALAAATAVLTMSLFIGAARFGWTEWAVVNRYWGWFILLAYAASGALLTKDFGRDALRTLLLTFAGAASAIALLELLLLVMNDLGLHLSLPLAPSALQGFSLNHNFFAFQLLMALAAVFVAVRDSRLRLGLLVLLLTTLYFSASRSGWLSAAALCGAALYIGSAKPGEIAKAVLGAAALALLIIAGTILVGGRSSAGMPGIIVNSLDTQMRMMSILGGLRLFMQHPILGAGLGAFRHQLILIYSDQPLLIHSTSVWLLAELGLAGLLTFAVPAIYALIAEWRRRQTDRAGQLIVLCLVVFGAMSLPADMLYQRTFWLLFGAALILKRDPIPIADQSLHGAEASA